MTATGRLCEFANVRNRAAQFFCAQGNFHCSKADFRQQSLSTQSRHSGTFKLSGALDGEVRPYFDARGLSAAHIHHAQGLVLPGQCALGRLDLEKRKDDIQSEVGLRLHG